MKISFVLSNKTNKQGEQLLMLRVAYANHPTPFRHSMKISLKPKLWIHKRQTVSSKHPNAQLINVLLSDTRKTVEQFFLEQRIAGKNEKQISKEDLRKALNGEEDSATEILTFIDEYLDVKSRTVKPSTARVVTHNVNLFRYYIESLRQSITTQDTTLEFMNGYFHWLLEVRGQQNSTAKTSIMHANSFLKWVALNHRDNNLNDEYKLFTFPKSLHTTKDRGFALGLQELEQLQAYRPTRTKQIETQSFFLFGCYTGLRYSDIESLTDDMYSEISVDEKRVSIITIVTRKTETKTVIPLIPPALTIWKQQVATEEEKYPFKCVGNNDVFNNKLRILSRDAGLNRMHTFHTYHGTKRGEKSSPIHEQITSHCMRRTFVTLAKNFGIPDHIVQSITGHTTVEMMSKYNKTSTESIANEILSKWQG